MAKTGRPSGRSVVTGCRHHARGDIAAYTLRTGTSEARLARISGSLLHLLAQDDTLAVGNDSWSYTLSQVASAAERPAWTPIEAEQNRASVTEIYVDVAPAKI